MLRVTVFRLASTFVTLSVLLYLRDLCIVCVKYCDAKGSSFMVVSRLQAGAFCSLWGPVRHCMLPGSHMLLELLCAYMQPITYEATPQKHLAYSTQQLDSQNAMVWFCHFEP